MTAAVATTWKKVENTTKKQDGSTNLLNIAHETLSTTEVHCNEMKWIVPEMSSVSQNNQKGYAE